MNYLAARTIMFGVIKTYADTLSKTVSWPDIPLATKPATGYFAVALRHVTGKQTALALGSSGEKLFERAGIGSVTINTPIADGLVAGYTQAQGLTDAFQSASTSVWFRNVRIRELGSEGGYERILVVWDFEYTDQQ